jgi:hypothetical protein
MLRLMTALGATLFAVAVAAGALLLLPACGALPWANHCPPTGYATAARMAELDAANIALGREVGALERELVLLQCTAALPEPPPLPSLPPLPQPPIDTEAWQRRDIGAMDGCWELDSDYRTQNDRTGEITHFTAWTMCFAADGQGRATMRATNGTTCEGPVTGSFAADGRLVVTEAGNLACSDATFIYRRDLGCALLDDGAASCSVEQPQVGRSSTVLLRRAAPDPAPLPEGDR